MLAPRTDLDSSKLIAGLLSLWRSRVTQWGQGDVALPAAKQLLGVSCQFSSAVPGKVRDLVSRKLTFSPFGTIPFLYCFLFTFSCLDHFGWDFHQVIPTLQSSGWIIVYGWAPFPVWLCLVVFIIFELFSKNGPTPRGGSSEDWDRRIIS